jgi:hypothetical protein
MAPLQSPTKLQSLIEIDHQVHFAPDCLPNGLDRREIVSETLAAKAELQAIETALFPQLDRLARNFLGGLQPEAIAVVGRNRAETAPQQSGKPAAFANASQAAMSTPAIAIIDMPS